MECGHNGGEGHAAGTLDVIVEACQLRLIAFQDTASVCDTKVLARGVRGGEALVERMEYVRTFWLDVGGLQVDVSFGKEPVRCLDKGIDKVVIFFALHAAFLQTEVEIVFEEVFVLKYDELSRLSEV